MSALLSYAGQFALNVLAALGAAAFWVAVNDWIVTAIVVFALVALTVGVNVSIASQRANERAARIQDIANEALGEPQ